MGRYLLILITPTIKRLKGLNMLIYDQSTESVVENAGFILSNNQLSYGKTQGNIQ